MSENQSMHVKVDDRTAAVLEDLDALARRRYDEEDAKVGPGQYPFKSAIVRAALRIAAPAIRSGLEREGIAFLYP